MKSPSLYAVVLLFLFSLSVATAQEGDLCGISYGPYTEAEDCDWGPTSCHQVPYLPLSDAEPPDYENLGFAGIADAYLYHNGSINVTNDGTPEANITITPEVYVKTEASNRYYCFKTLLLDLDKCEILDEGSSVDEKDYAFISSQDRILRQYEREDSYAFGYSSTPIARCTRTGDLGRGESETQEMELVINPSKYLVAASKPSYRCSEYATEYACSKTEKCVWDEESGVCEFQPYEDFTAENQVKYWLMDAEKRCFILEAYGGASNHTWTLVNDLLYKALVEHYHSMDGADSLADLSGDDSLPDEPATFYNIHTFLGADEVYATFFEAWAKHYIRSLGGMDESERLYCYKTGLRDDSYCYELPYMMYSFTENANLLSVDELYIRDQKNWNDVHAYINEMPDKDSITFKGPDGTVIPGTIMGPKPLEDITKAWHGLWVRFFMLSPLISVTGPIKCGVWGYAEGVDTDRYVGSGQDRKDACDWSCRHGTPCELLEECDPFDPMDDDATQYDHCPNENPHFDLCSGFDSEDDPPGTLQTGPCKLYRGVDDECKSDEEEATECTPALIPPHGDCWGTPSGNIPCEVITQYQFMRDCPPEECNASGYGQAGFEKVEVPWYERIWGSDNIKCKWKLLSWCEKDGCVSCLGGSQAYGYSIIEQKEEAPGPLCLTKYILEGGGKASTKFKVGLSSGSMLPFGEPQRMEIYNISENIWMSKGDGVIGELKIIDTGNVPFQVTCAYWIASEPYFDDPDTAINECKDPDGCSDITAVRYYKSKLGRWSGFTIDSDVFRSNVVNSSYMKLKFIAKQDYLTGIREDRFYTACDRLNCNCEECLCTCPCPSGIVPTYKFILADSNTGYKEDVCGGVSEKIMLICTCSCDGPCCRSCPPHYCDYCFHQWREEILSWYHEQNTTTIESEYHVYNWEKVPWIYNGCASGWKDSPIYHHLVLDATRYKEGDFIVTYGFINFTIQPDLFRGMTLLVGDSDADAHKIITPIQHSTIKKKSSSAGNSGYGLGSRYGYEFEKYEFPEQCQTFCDPPPVCECDPEDIMRPLCMNTSPLRYRDDIEELLCNHYSDNPVVERICTDGSIQDNKQAIDDLCTRYLNEIGLLECEFEHNRVYCFDEFRFDALYMACYGDRLIERDDCVCAPDKRYDNPCTSNRTFHEDEGSVIVNGDFEMGFDTGLGPWEATKGSPIVKWMGRNGYALFLSEGSSVIQYIPLGATSDPDNQLCLEFGVDSNHPGKIRITIDEGDEYEYHTEDCDVGWNKICYDVSPQMRSIEIEALESNLIVDNVNVGKAYDFVIFGNKNIEDMTWYGLEAAKSMGGFNKLVVVDFKHNVSDAVFPGGHYYTLYFRTDYEPYRHLYSGEEDYDIIPRDEFEDGKLVVDTLYESRVINLSDADEFKIRDAVELTYKVEPEGVVLSPGTEVTVKLWLYNIDKNRGESGKRVDVWSKDIDISTLSPNGLSEEDGEYFVVTDADGYAEFTLNAHETFSLEMKHHGDVDPTGRSLDKVVRFNVVEIYTPLLSPEILLLLAILVVAVFSYKFLGVGRMELESWLEDLRGRR
ncbi:MAG: hypothetical protein B6U72_01775 [Candidatus Altiarchaeales archaeon ex4484_2]|nr:MAG: hypothetical protein B6U72_01775 [Candidatus Altiarchaeales archaeon ex4484_2]